MVTTTASLSRRTRCLWTSPCAAVNLCNMTGKPDALTPFLATFSVRSDSTKVSGASLLLMGCYPVLSAFARQPAAKSGLSGSRASGSTVVFQLHTGSLSRYLPPIDPRCEVEDAGNCWINLPLSRQGLCHYALSLIESYTSSKAPQATSSCLQPSILHRILCCKLCCLGPLPLC